MGLKGGSRVVTGFVMLVAATAGRSQEMPGLVAPPPSPRLPSGIMGGVALGTSLPLRALKGQPYSLVETTTSFRTLQDGTTMTNVRVQHRMRDAEGRERTERGEMKDGVYKVTLISLSDPVACIIATLFPVTRKAMVTHMPQPKPVTPEEEERIAASRARAEAYRKEHPTSGPAGSEPLPPKSVDGLYAEGTRRTLIIPVGREGNDREIRVVSETWYSPDLKITLGSETDDPRSGKLTTVVSDLKRVDPAPELFQVPPDYTVQSRP